MSSPPTNLSNRFIKKVRKIDPSNSLSPKYVQTSEDESLTFVSLPFLPNYQIQTHTKNVLVKFEVLGKDKDHIPLLKCVECLIQA